MMASTRTKPRLLIISHAYAAIENRKKLQALSHYFDLTCATAVAGNFMVLGRPASADDSDADASSRNYRLIRLHRLGGSFTTCLFQNLGPVIRSEDFDLVLVENEPWALLRWQARLLTACILPDAVFGEFTWENVERPSWKGWILSFIYRAMTATTDFIIAGNQAAGALVERRGARRETILVAPQLGVDLSNHQPATMSERTALREKLGLPADALLVGYCGRLTEEKGLRELVQACAERPNVHLVILGSGRLLPWLSDQQRTRPWLHLLPPRTHGEIPDFLRCLDLFVLASQPVHTLSECWEEQFGHVLIEAMACGVATVGSDSGAIPEVLGTPEAVFRHTDVESLRATLDRFLNDEAARADLAHRQLDRTRRHFTHEAISATWAEFLCAQSAGTTRPPTPIL